MTGKKRWRERKTELPCGEGLNLVCTRKQLLHDRRQQKKSPASKSIIMRKAREGETDKSGSQSEWSVSCTAAKIIHLYTRFFSLSPCLQCQPVGKASSLPFLALLIPHFIPHAVQRSVSHTLTGNYSTESSPDNEK